jgi:hypothetical protein
MGTCRLTALFLHFSSARLQGCHVTGPALSFCETSGFGSECSAQVHILKMLSILRKARLKDKEMRVLMLSVLRFNIRDSG